MQTVQTALLPFNLKHKPVEVIEGLSVAEIVKIIFPHRVQGVEIVVNIGGHVIPRDKWNVVRPKKHAQITVNAVAAGGGGKKNPLAIILAVAVAVVAPYLAPSIGTNLGLAVTGSGVLTSAQTALFTGVVKIGISMVGSLLLSALTSVPKQRGGISEPSTNFIEGASNALDPFGVIPINLGTNRIFPKQAARPYTETIGNRQFVRQLFTYGYGKVVISDRKLGETSLSEFKGVEMEDRLNADLNSGTGLYANDVYQEGMSVVLSNAIGYVTRTTQLNADEAVLDITFGRGLTAFGKNNVRVLTTVKFEVQFAPTGTSDWSTGTSGKTFASQNLTIPAVVSRHGSITNNFGVIFLNTRTGVASVVSMNALTDAPQPPADHIRIASYSRTATVVTMTDERASYIPSVISSGFTQSVVGSTLTIASGVIATSEIEISNSTAEPFRTSHRMVFPTRGQYDVRIKRLTADSAVDTLVDEATITAIQTITYITPVNKTDISGSSIRMEATDQLNGAVDNYNVLASTIVKYYDSATSSWVEGISSNPSAIYRYVLQSEAFVKRLSDAEIDLDKLEEWSVYCDDNNLTYNRYIDYDASIDEILNDIAAAGFATKHNVDGIYGVIIDNERPTIKGLITPRNSWGYRGNISYPEIPHGLRVQFRNKDKNYLTDERIVYADGYNSSNATLFERVEFLSCDNASLAYMYGKRYLATAVLQPEVHNFSVDFENLTFNRGDRISFVNDTILVGVGQGRIKELITSGSNVTGFIIDESVDIPSANNFAVRIRHGDATGFIYYPLITSIGTTDMFTFTTPVASASAPPVGSLCAFVEDGKELDLIVTEIKSAKGESAQITAINYAPERFNPLGVIPAFSSNVTIPSDFIAPEPPVLGGDIVSDESVMVRNSDGSFISRMIIPLINPNKSDVDVIVRANVKGSNIVFTPDMLVRSEEQVILTGLQDGSEYDFQIYYQREAGRRLLSKPLLLNSVKYVGASTAPAQVQNFTFSVLDSIGIFEWTPNTDIDLSHYQVRFSSLTTGATWGNSQVSQDNIRENRVLIPIQDGTYFIKAFDILGKESIAATSVRAVNVGSYNNVVETLTQETSWSGTKTNCQVVSGKLVLTDTTLEGIYEFSPSPKDMGEIYESILSSSIRANLINWQPIRGVPSVRSLSSVRGSFLSLRKYSSIRSLTSIRAVDTVDWSINLEMNLSSDNIVWTGWIPFTNTRKTFRYAKFRLRFSTSNSDTNVQISSAGVTIDMPDRYESGEGINCPIAGVTITYAVAFKNDPSVQITLQNEAVDDRIEYVSKGNTGFTIKVYNATVGGYVSRNFDYISTGYGRVL